MRTCGRRAAQGAQGERPRNRPLLATGAPALLIQPVPQLRAPVAQKTQSRTLTISRAPHDPAIIIIIIFPLAPGWVKYIRWEPSGLLPGNPSCGFH